MNLFESRSHRLLPPKQFVLRLARSAAVVAVLVALSLFAGMLGYHALEGLSWMDAFLNAAMLLGGMGPVTAPATEAGKLFAGLYALYCGLIVIIATGFLLAPVAHRVLLKFHMEQKGKGDSS